MCRAAGVRPFGVPRGASGSRDKLAVGGFLPGPGRAPVKQPPAPPGTTNHATWYASGMRGAIDKAGRVVIPKVLRERLGLRPGPVELVEDGGGVRVEPLAHDEAVEEGERLVIPPSGTPIDDDLVQALRDADQR